MCPVESRWIPLNPVASTVHRHIIYSEKMRIELMAIFEHWRSNGLYYVEFKQMIGDATQQ
jgi:hypothetical protein